MLFDRQVLNLCIFVLVFLNDINEYNIVCVFYPLMDVIIIFGGGGV